MTSFSEWCSPLDEVLLAFEFSSHASVVPLADHLEYIPDEERRYLRRMTLRLPSRQGIQPLRVTTFERFAFAFHHCEAMYDPNVPPSLRPDWHDNGTDAQFAEWGYYAACAVTLVGHVLKGEHPCGANEPLPYKRWVSANRLAIEAFVAQAWAKQRAQAS